MAAAVLVAWRGKAAAPESEADAVSQLREIVKSAVRGAPSSFVDSLSSNDVVTFADGLTLLPNRTLELPPEATGPVDELRRSLLALITSASVKQLASQADVTLEDVIFAVTDPGLFNAVQVQQAMVRAPSGEATVAAYEEALKSVDVDRWTKESAQQQQQLVKAKEAQEQRDTSSVPSADLRDIHAGPFAKVLHDRAALSSQLELLDAVFNELLSADQRSVTKYISAFAADWDEHIAELESKLAAASEESAALLKEPAPRPLPDEDLSMDHVSSLLRSVKERRTAVLSRVDANNAQQASFDEKLVEFNRERQRLLLWCRQEKANLDGTTDVDAVQEFCATLLNHTPAMESNMAVLLDMAEPLLPHPVVQAALLETNEVWLNLHIAAYERLRRTLLEVHDRAKLEDEIRAYAGYSTSAAEFLAALLRLLGEPTTAESASLVSDVVDTAKQLLGELNTNHANLPTQLRDFALRMEGFRDNYANLRRAVFTRLTYLASTVPTLSASARRKEEYAQRMHSLQRWVQAKSRGESWADIKERLEKLRSMVSEEKAAMAREPPLSAAVTQPVV